MRRRAETIVRSFAQLYDTGGVPRTHLHGHTNILVDQSGRIIRTPRNSGQSLNGSVHRQLSNRASPRFAPAADLGYRSAIHVATG